MSHLHRFVSIVSLLVILFLPDVGAQNTAFTYQGRLKDGGNPANGLYDVRFTLYDDATAGSIIAGPAYADDKTVADGLFTAELDFGAPPFDGTDRWLEIAVRPGSVDNADRTGYTALSPRQKITNNPYALFSRNSDKLSGQTSIYYLDASHITSGTLSTDRFSAYDNLTAEGRIGMAAVQVAPGIHLHSMEDLVGILSDAQIPVSIARESELRKTYDAIVATSGGDYTSLYEALNAGKTSIFVRNGTYTVYANLVLSSDNISIVGESRDGVVINCGGAVATCFKAEGDTSNYIDGTVTIANGTTTVTGTGTAWATNTKAGEYILLGYDWYQIKGVTSDTELDVARTYWGRDLTNATYKIAAMLSNINIENITIKDKTAVYFRWVLNAMVRNCHLLNNSTEAMYFQECYNNRILNNIIQNSNNESIELYYCNHFQIIGNIVEDVHYNSPIYLDNSNYNTLLDNKSCNNSNFGIYLSSSSWNVIKGNVCNNNNYGIYLSASTQNMLSGNICIANSTYGIYINSNSNANTISGNLCKSSISASGIRIGSTSNYNTLQGNLCYDNAVHGIHFSGNSSECVVLSNVCRGNANYGINITAGSNNNIVGMNQLSGNTTAPGLDSGTGTVISANYPSFP